MAPRGSTVVLNRWGELEIRDEVIFSSRTSRFQASLATGICIVSAMLGAFVAKFHSLV